MCRGRGARSRHRHLFCVNIARRESVRSISHKYNTSRCAAARRAHVEQVNTINVQQCMPALESLFRTSDDALPAGPTALHTSLSVEQGDCVCLRSKIYGSIHYTTHNASAYTINKIARALANIKHFQSIFVQKMNAGTLAERQGTT